MLKLEARLRMVLDETELMAGTARPTVTAILRKITARMAVAPFVTKS